MLRNDLRCISVVCVGCCDRDRFTRGCGRFGVAGSLFQTAVCCACGRLREAHKCCVSSRISSSQCTEFRPLTYELHKKVAQQGLEEIQRRQKAESSARSWEAKWDDLSVLMQRLERKYDREKAKNKKKTTKKKGEAK